MTYTIKELLANKVSADAVGWRRKRKRCGLRLTWVAHMLDVDATSLSHYELGKQVPPPYVAATLDALYARWHEACAKQRELEADLRAMIEDGTTNNHRRHGGRPRKAKGTHTSPLRTGRPVTPEDE